MDKLYSQRIPSVLSILFKNAPRKPIRNGDDAIIIWKFIGRLSGRALLDRDAGIVGPQESETGVAPEPRLLVGCSSYGSTARGRSSLRRSVPSALGRPWTAASCIGHPWGRR